MWSSPDAFLDLPKSVSDAAQFYQAQEGYATKKLFWSQFGASKRPLLLNEQMTQWAKLAWAKEQAKMSNAAAEKVAAELKV